MNTCKGKIKGAMQTPVTKDVDLAREILDEEQDIAIDCRTFPTNKHLYTMMITQHALHVLALHISMNSCN